MRAVHGAGGKRIDVLERAGELDLPETLLCARRSLETLLITRRWPRALDGWRRDVLHDALMSRLPDDGANRFQTLLRVVLPIATPGLAVVALFAFTHAWNEFLYALVFVYSADTKTFTAGLSGLIMGDTFIWGQLMASSVIAILPIFIIYVVAQRYIVEGLSAGSVKG